MKINNYSTYDDDLVIPLIVYTLGEKINIDKVVELDIMPMSVAGTPISGLFYHINYNSDYNPDTDLYTKTIIIRDQEINIFLRTLKINKLISDV